MRGDSGFPALALGLIQRAERLARAHGEMRLRTRRGDASRWRMARLLWPSFADRRR